MSEYVHEDKTTIHEYVTSPSLDPVTASTPDVHGVFPINPLGFPDTDVCDGDPECLAKGNPEFPQSKNFLVGTGSGADIPDQYVEIAANVSDLTGTVAVFPILKLEARTLGVAGSYKVTVGGNVVEALPSVSISFINAGYEDYSVTNIVGHEATVSGGGEYDGERTVFTVSSPECKITGSVGEGRLSIGFGLKPDPSEDSYVLLTGQYNAAENGLYLVTGEDEPWVKTASVCRVKGEPLPDAEDPYNSPASLDNSLECGHVRHGYSDREVADYVERKTGDIVSGTVHPRAVPGDLAGAGRLTRWFVECGDIAIGDSHEDGETVTVDGFGLGGYLSGECTYGDMCTGRTSKKHETAQDENPVVTFSIGTRRPESGTAAETLPKDWPFTGTSDYVSPGLDNNITLLRKPVHDGTGDTLVGGLQHDVYAPCPKCGGTGSYSGTECPECGGTGEVIVGHSDSNRIHVCVNNDFTPNGNDTTTFKKTYIHLPTPIDTKDGDEFEVTVSLPVVETPAAYGVNDKKNISAYYEYVSSPRVYVLSGYWKFSDTKLEWRESSNIAERTYATGIIDIAGSDVQPFTARDGSVLQTPARVRFTLDGGLNCPRMTDMLGTLDLNVAGHVRLVDMEGYPYTARLRDLRMRICGLAYLDPEDDGLPTGTDTMMGLHSRNLTTMVYDDAGPGGVNDLDAYNKFVKPLDSGTAPGRKALCGTDTDARMIVATVYPTVTNTFPWAMVGRHKMKHLDVLMTDEWDLGEDSISAMIWNSNKKVIDFTDTVGFFGYGDSCYGFTADTMPLRYSDQKFHGSTDKSVIGSQVRIKFSETGYDLPSSNPVRQARKAASMLADDFRKLRMFRGSKLPKVTGASGLAVSGAPVSVPLDEYFDAWNPSGTPSADVTGNAIASAAWLSKARHLPEYVIVSGQDMSSTGNSLIGADPFVYGQASTRYKNGFAADKYGNGYYATKDGHEVIPCEVSLPGVRNAFAYRSVITARVESDPDAVNHDLYGDASRVAELQKVSIDRWKPGIDYDITRPYDYLLDSGDYSKWMDIYSATSNVFSIDTIPVPDDCDVPNDLSHDQQAMISGDPLASYNVQNGSALEFVATNLPFYDSGTPRSDALSSILRKMVAPFGSCMPVRFWDGTRVAVATDGMDDDIIRMTRLEWPESECAMSPETRSDIIADEFMGKSAGSKTADVNITYANMESTLHMNWSAPPVKATRAWYNRAPFTGTGSFAGPSGYVRVFMKFKFSAQSGRWYTVDYRQAPMSYLSPLYGANALEEKIDGIGIWSESMCAPHGDWKDVLMRPYSMYSPMDISPAAVAVMVENGPTDPNSIEIENNTDLRTSRVSIPRLERPYMPVSEGGIGLNAPCDVNGHSADNSVIAAMPHSNFWSVRKHLRPAVSVIDGSDIPGYTIGDDGYAVHSRTGGTMGDSVLWGQFDFPKKNKLKKDDVEYIIPPCSF